MKTKYYICTSLILFVLILVVGYSNKVELSDIVIWSDRPVNWLDFQQVEEIDDDFDAAIFSEIYCPNIINEDNPLVYAFMDPNQSERLKDSVLDPQLLKHEQYHFNITEYHARLLRKQIVKKGEENISTSTLQELYDMYDKERAKMQSEYDEISEHNANTQKQRYWELKIDDLLRQTAYYNDPNIYNYYDFTKRSTEYYKHIYHTLEHEILTSYPISKADHKYGKCYKVERNDKEVIIKYYKNGKLTNGGIFKTAITKIIKPTDSISEMHYYNKDLTRNTVFNRSISKTIWNANNDMTTSYFDENENPIEYKSVHKTIWKYDSKTKNRYSSYYDINKKQTTNNDLVFRERREFDRHGRTIKISNFNSEDEPMNDKDYISIYDYVLDDFHKIKRTRLYDKEGSFATHLSEYNLHYNYDERGNLVKFMNLDKNGGQTENNEGICMYEYSYDLKDNYTSVRTYNASELPVIGNDDYFIQVWDYDHKNRIKFTAKYYDGYVLAFDDNRNGAIKYEYINDSVRNVLNIDVYNTIFKNDYGYAIRKQYTNKDEKVVRELFLDENECFATSEDGIEIHEYAYDEKGNLIKEKKLDSLGKLKPHNKDVAITHWEYDHHNNKTKTTYYQTDSILANANQNVTYNVYNYNKDNLFIERTNYDKNMNPALLNGVFKTIYEYNSIGKDTLVKEFDTQNKLIKGVCTTHYTYNQYGNITRETYYNSRNQKVSYQNGISAIEYLYDNQQRYIGHKNYNRFDNPTNDGNGIFYEKKTLNRSGDLISYEYFNKKGFPVIGPNGYHKVIYEYNDSDLLIKESTYDTDFNLVNDNNGVAEYEYTRAASSLIKTMKYYDKNGEPTENKNGIAETIYLEAMNGLYFLEKQLDINGEEIKKDVEE
ncbi:hypothetical protein D1818_00430 [Aquimarina sp. BL5]|uniref:hypothetical protein n=1 Tax=Aquimarina sp. BL5 TaxID=1714860 RepID=UPI000E4FF200|nr:hypothetical protein [Aquimarina sp. BL5]AXT49358.1 hypothetical protein D1818_00430 [Aquimarina sp. BL5]RKN02341.1 hypothetical protein D7036_16570 [Aquimarina sp. BL5]